MKLICMICSALAMVAIAAEPTFAGGGGKGMGGRSSSAQAFWAQDNRAQQRAKGQAKNTISKKGAQPGAGCTDSWDGTLRAKCNR